MVRKKFINLPSRVNLIKEMFPRVPLPPEFVIIRWGIRIKVDEYYCSHLFKISEIVTALENNTEVIKSMKKVIKNPNLVTNKVALRLFGRYNYKTGIIEKTATRKRANSQGSCDELKIAARKKIKDSW